MRSIFHSQRGMLNPDLGGPLEPAIRMSGPDKGFVFRKWSPPAGLLLGATMMGRRLPGWAWMWVIALSLFFGAKWITVFALMRSNSKVRPLRLAAYIFLWPGMDALKFCGSRSSFVPVTSEWIMPVAKTVFGAALVWLVAGSVVLVHPAFAGWVGMIGMVFVLHFGLFHLLSLVWRSVGIEAEPIMRSPTKATSLARFWGERWNTAFSNLMQRHIFVPLARHIGPRKSLLGVFLISGLLHELVISVPARGGYGLPTLYFVFQGFGLRFERSRVGKRLGLCSGWKGWAFVALVAGLPALWLFHPPFIRNVILPMLQAIGAVERNYI